MTDFNMDSSQENRKFHEGILKPSHQMIQKGIIFCINCGDHFTFIEELSGHCNSVENCQTLENERYLKKYMIRILPLQIACYIADIGTSVAHHE